jgi:hypothetical protein
MELAIVGLIVVCKIHVTKFGAGISPADIRSLAESGERLGKRRTIRSDPAMHTERREHDKPGVMRSARRLAD